MSRQPEKQLQQHLVEEFKESYQKQFSMQERQQIIALLQAYYRYVPTEELQQEGTSDLIGAVIAHWQLMFRRKGDAPAVRVYNPNFEEHGWQSTHTIVEVVADDMAFLVDSLSMGLNRTGLTIFLTLHPVICTERNDNGELLQIEEISCDLGRRESLIRFQVEKQLSADVLQALEQMIHSVIRDVRQANSDWLRMKEQVQQVARRMGDSTLPVEAGELAEAKAFLEWVERDHFAFLAYCEFDLVSHGGKELLQLDDDSILGLFQLNGDAGHDAEALIPVMGNHFSHAPCYLVVNKANARSTVHRPAYMDFIGIKRHNDKGEVDGLYCILGLFSSAAYSSPPGQIPLLRTKVEEVIKRANLVYHSHSGKVLHNILDTYPRDALFQIPIEHLTEISLGILSLQERQRTRLFLFRDPFKRFYSCLVYLPRERYNRELRLRIQKVLVEAFNGVEVEFNTLFSESILARVQYTIQSSTEETVEYDRAELEQKIVEATMTWQDGLHDALLELYGEAVAAQYFREYSQAFPGGFREDFFPRTAATDIGRIEQARKGNGLALHFYRPIIESTDQVHFRLYSLYKPVPLSQAIPIMENMGLSVFGERPYRIRHADGDIWIHDFTMRWRGAEGLGDEVSQLFQEAYQRVWEGGADDDGFNQLVLSAGLSWRQVVILRAYGRYLKQIKFPYSQPYIIDSLNRYANISALLIELFELRFDPDRSLSETRLERLLANIEKQLDKVSSLDQDRILRSFMNLIMSTLRCNYYQRDQAGEHKSYLSFKIDSQQVDDMPLPRPMFEIFVFSARMEGVHLRGGHVARGGLRWSDRMDDFRTEVLGLMKAQMVKNTVIVPVGSKGGFIVKQMPQSDDRERVMKEVIFCYSTFLRGMLDLTDNLVDGEVVAPPQLRRHDEDDPYLVIAADKGTATFSDIANGIAAEYGFWLDDAFASGGSAGYDHKKMGITAKGAWESVKRNFRELGRDIQSKDFTVVGIGDMSGDVFGNGMLLSRHIKLVAAFNHLHIFLDPDPDPAASFKERQRLFKLPRSNWKEYDKKLISSGGGIYARSAKSIPISDPVKALLGTKSERLAPNDLISLLLKAPVDLLWNGGIGTYVKASSETHADVRDKANDALRVDGQELRCKVVGEGGNLGVTQLGRVEYASKGGLIYTDAIDNSAGVDCSDHEVNIKILLGQIVASGEMTRKQRNRLQVEMTDEVARLVLADNYSQTQSISMVASEAPERLYEHARFIDFLEQKEMLNRELEYLPSKQNIAERQAQKRGLTKPEIAVLHAYSKMTYYDALIHSDIPDDEYLQSELHHYFPQILGERYSSEMRSHRLRREIISTHLTNSIVDHIGPGFGFRVREEVGANIAGVTRAYLAVSKIYDTDRLWQQIEALDNQVASAVQIEMMRILAMLLERAVVWVLHYHRNNVVIKELVDFFQPGVAELRERLPKPLVAKDRLALNRRIKYFVNAGVPRELAQQVCGLVPLAAALDIVTVAKQTGRDTPLVASTYYTLGITLDLHWLRRQIGNLAAQTHWHNLAKTRLIDTLNSHQRELTAQILQTTRPYKSARKMVDQWVENSRYAYDRHTQMISELKARTSVDFAMLSVVVAGSDSMRAGKVAET